MKQIVDRWLFVGKISPKHRINFVGNSCDQAVIGHMAKGCGGMLCRVKVRPEAPHSHTALI